MVTAVDPVFIKYTILEKDFGLKKDVVEVTFLY